MCNLDFKPIKSFFIKKNTKKFIRVLIILILLFLFTLLQLYIIQLFFPVIGDLFKSNFDDFTYNQITASIIYSIILIILSYFELIFINSITKPGINSWIYWTIILMIIVMLIGFVFINTEFGAKPLSFRLREVSHIENVLGNITCKGLNPQVLAGEIAICNIEPKLKIVSAELFTINAKGDENQVNILGRERLNFTTPFGNVKLQFNIEGFDSKGNKQFLSTTSSYEFLTKEEYAKKREKFLTYLVGLFFVALFSIPAMMVNIKELRKKDKNA